MAKIEHLFINLTMANKNQEFSDFYLALQNEISTLKENQQLQIKTIYLATADFLLLTNQELAAILALLAQFNSNNLIEYTFEIGYQVLTQDQLAVLQQFQINRLVWKVRTFNQTLLAKINPQFSSSEMIDLIKTAKKLGFQNFSLDLEHNLLEQTAAVLLDDLEFAYNLKTPHISYQSATEEHNQEHKKIISDFLVRQDYQNYEWFSFATNESYFSQQTLAYLSLNNWYGMGPGATSFFKANNQNTIGHNSSLIPWTKETTTLATADYYQLLFMQGLMNKKGFFLDDELKKQKFWPQVQKLMKQGYLQIKSNYLCATKQGWDLLNQILLDIIESTEIW